KPGQPVSGPSCDTAADGGSVFFFQAEDGIRDFHVTGVQTCALPIYDPAGVERLKQGFKPVVVVVDAPHVCGRGVPGGGDPFQLGLCLVDEVVNVAVPGVANLCDASPGLD